MAAEARPLLQVDGVAKSFGGVAAVADASFTASSGETVGLIGPNGAGKTTLFNMICGPHRPDTGRIYFDGKEISRAPAHTVASLGVGRTYQVVRPFADETVLFNVMVASLLRHRERTAAEDRAYSILIDLGLESRAGHRAGELTLAQRKRLEVAKALALEPKLLLLDEVMAGLNPAEIEEAIGMVRRISESGVTVVVIEHIMQAVMSLADRIIVLDSGKVIADGPPESVVRDPEVVAAYLGKDYGDARD